MKKINILICFIIVLFSINSFASNKIKTNIFTPPNKRNNKPKKQEKIDTMTIDSFEIQAVINIGNNRKLLLKIVDKKLKEKLADKLDSKGFLVLRKGSSIDGYTYLANRKDAVLFEKNGKIISIPLFAKTNKKLQASKNQTVVATKQIITNKGTSNQNIRTLPNAKRPINHKLPNRKISNNRNKKSNHNTKPVTPETTKKTAHSFVEIFKRAAENSNNQNPGSNPFMNLFK